MSKKQLPPQETLCQFLRYDQESGKLFWKERSPEMVFDGGPRKAKRTSNQLNSFLAGKEAFTFTDRRGYRHGTFLGKAYQAHRVIWKMVYGVDPDTIDHIDGDQGNNRIANLRSCSNAENSRNYAKPEGGSSKYRGVCWVKRDKAWAARISAGDLGKINLGYFHNEIEAARAYDRAAIVYHGGFAKTNFPRTDYETRIRSALVDAPPASVTENPGSSPAAKTDEDPIGWLYFNPDAGTEFSPEHPIDTGDCPDAEQVRAATVENLLSELQESWELLGQTRRQLQEIPAPSANPLMEQMEGALRENFCPRPCNGRPDDFSVGQCFDAGECGCGNRAALDAFNDSKKQRT